MRRNHCQFRDNTRRARIATAALGLSGALDAVDLVFYAYVWGTIDHSDLDEFAAFGEALGHAHVGALLACAITFLLWLRRAYENAAAAGMQLRYPLAHSILGWFIPFANLLIPPQIVGDTYRHAMNTKGAGIVGLWWAAQLGSAFIANMGGYVAGAASTVGLEEAMVAGIVSAALSIAAAILAITIVTRTTRHARAIDPEIADVFGDAAVKR